MTSSSIQILRDIEYGQAIVGHGSAQPRLRPLLLDVYLPPAHAQAQAQAQSGVQGLAGAGPAARPALIMSHGGAYHRGAKDRDEFEQDGARNTPVHEYCEHFAARGLVCFSVGYRLTQENPAPQTRPIKRNRDTVSRGRIDYVRSLLGLPPATDRELLDGAEAVYADAAQAFRFVQSQAALWNIDPQRIAMGGFSAGAFASTYAAYAMGMPAVAIVNLSGGMDTEDAQYYVHGTRGQPPVLLFSGEHDLPGIPERTSALAEAAQAAGLQVQRYLVPGAPHFYEKQAEILPISLPERTPAAPTVLAAIEQFLDEHLQPARVDVDMLEAFAQAWSRHDIEALMSFMSDDCVFHSSSGPDASGTRFVGRQAVRDGFMKAWADIPDAQWTRARHVVTGPRGLSEWTFTGTRASDGARIEVDGCDLFTFKGDKIRVKDSWRKTRVL